MRKRILAAALAMLLLLATVGCTPSQTSSQPSESGGESPSDPAQSAGTEPADSAALNPGIDPTTDGVGDSAQAMTYTEPRRNG